MHRLKTYKQGAACQDNSSPSYAGALPDKTGRPLRDIGMQGIDLRPCDRGPSDLRLQTLRNLLS